ncbi:MAG: cellulase family glycosylhydrolase [Alphaproteobacteria bacterium]|nr:cellulase family glycosylhydrolase [Alphaproteobacteria bacterium]
MGSGFNLGNTFENLSHSTNPKDIFPIIDFYYNIGMRHIRIPTIWLNLPTPKFTNLADSNGHVNFKHPRFLQLKSVIDYAINKGMFVVLNTHHETWIHRNYHGSATQNKFFSTLWG